MSKFIHIVFGDSAAGILKCFFSENENKYKGEVICFREDYSIGPLYDIETEVGLENRIKWIEKIIKQLYLDDYFVDIETLYKTTYEGIKNIDSDLKIVIWYGESASELVGLSYLVSVLKNKSIYKINVSRFEMNDYSGNKYKPRSLGECNLNQLESLILTMEEIESEELNKISKCWENLKISKENLRILEGNTIVGVDEDYYDNDILSNCSFNYKKTARVIGDTMGKSKQFIGDTYINYRVRKLIEMNRLEYRGNLKNMREFDIKIKSTKDLD